MIAFCRPEGLWRAIKYTRSYWTNSSYIASESPVVHWLANQ